MDLWIARRIWLCTDGVRRKHLLLVSLFCNLGLLGFFKYGGFLLDNLQPAMTALGIANHLPVWDIILPIGISFYTFASLSYTIDVYRNEIRGDCGLLDYALFVGFFPHLVAGPIVRAVTSATADSANCATLLSTSLFRGLSLTCIGLFAKVVLADSVFAPVVEQVYAEPVLLFRAGYLGRCTGFFRSDLF